MRIRRDVYVIEADPNDDTLSWYGRAVGAMKSRPITDPRSWRYQAAIHEYDPNDDPYKVNGEALPSPQEQRRHWNQCQHGSWFFLPWHRMYLHHFEQILLAEVVALGGPQDWALPYWNYSKDPSSRVLPPSFRSPTLANGTPNPLFVAQRRTGANAGQPIADDADVDLVGCLTATPFAGPPFGGPNFGGPQTGFSHSGAAAGRLEVLPHGSMHVSVGGRTGFMSFFNKAALDPIFWLHHSNIDRLWEVWLARDAGHGNPASAQWLSGVQFPFHAADGSTVTMTCTQVVDTTAVPLYYMYGDISDPLEEAFGVAVAGGVEAMAGIPQLIGATNEPFDVDPSAGPTELTVRAPRSPVGTESFGIESEPERVYLHLEHLTCPGMVTAIDVYLGLPKGVNPEKYPERRIARLPLFGIREASRPSGPQAGSGLTFALDVTQAFQRLEDAGDANYRDVSVTLNPIGERTDDRVRVGRVSLYAE